VGTVLSLGSIGIATGLDSSPASLSAAREVEELGYSTLWLTGGPLPGMQTVADVFHATRSLRIATGILSVDKYAASDVADVYDSLEAEQPGRLGVGLGGRTARSRCGGSAPTLTRWTPYRWKPVSHWPATARPEHYPC
jgi:alkanesulfonate monooxygenase SsuD/methylene tetrahydromethanopterin reductase-like flavin-dependent oxidoreductase (luciferase family)